MVEGQDHVVKVTVGLLGGGSEREAERPNEQVNDCVNQQENKSMLRAGNRISGCKTKVFSRSTQQSNGSRNQSAVPEALACQGICWLLVHLHIRIHLGCRTSTGLKCSRLE